MSALATIVGSLGELSESELRQLYLMVGVRLGNPDGSAGSKSQRKGGGKASNTNSKGGKTTPSKSGGKTASPSSKGNPQRKSQWANHPLYQEYSRLKKVVEAQAKEAKTSFNAVDTAESRAYRQAFTHWVEAKSSFRDHGKSGQTGQTQGKEAESEDDSEDEEEEDDKITRVPSPTSPPRIKSADLPPIPGPAKQLSGVPAKGKAKSK